MANISAKFRLIDEMSAKLDKIAQSGRNAMSQWERAGTAIDTAFDGAVVQTAQTAQSIDKSTDSVDKFTDAAAKAAGKADEYAEAMSDMESATNAASTATSDTEEALDGVARSADKAGDEIEDYGEQSEEAGRKSEEFGDKASEGIEALEQLLVTAGIVKMLEAIGEAFIGCVEDAIEFESAITGVYKTVDGTPEQLAAIADEVKELSLRIPATTTEIAAVAEAAGQLGIATENVMSFTEVMINLGEATNLSADEAASALAKFTNITGTSADEYENLGSTIVALGNNFATTEADIVAMSTRMASAGTLAGLTESDILALAASISSVGIEADAGGSSMSTLLSKMQLAVETGNESLEQFASVAGYTSEEFQKKWGEDAVGALYAFIDGLNDTERNGASATAVLDEMGITEIRLSNAIKALSNNSENLGEAIGFASDAWEENSALATEANTRYGTLESRLAMTKNAATNLSTAIGDVFTPTVGAAAEVGQNALEGMTTFVKNNPTVVKGVAALTAGVATFTVAIIAYTAATKVAKIAQAAFNAVANMNPYVLMASAIIGVTVALGTFAATMLTAENEMESLTASSRKQAKELENLEKEYDETAKLYGENSYEAWQLREEIDNLNEAYESSKQTAEEYREEVDALIQKLDEQREAYENATTGFDNEYESSMALIAKLQELGSESSLAARNQALIIPIIDELNSRYEGLGLTFDSLTGKFNMTTDQMQEFAQQEIDLKKREEDWKHYVEVIGEIPGAYDALAKAEAELDARQEEYDNKVERRNNAKSKRQRRALNINVKTAKSALEEQQGIVDDLQERYDYLIGEQERLEATYGSMSDAVANSGNGFITYEEAVNSALGSVQTEITELCEKYDEAYEAARDSIDGQIGLFDDMVVEVEKTVEEMLGAWESQILYLNSYTENLKKAMDFGLDRSLVEQLSDGSTESAAYLDTIISKIEDLGGTTESAKKFVDDFNKKFQEVETAKDEFAGQVADIKTNFSDEMEKIEDRLDEAIDNMNMQEDAAAAAKATMSGYIAEIIAGGNSAVAAAADAAARVQAALASGQATTATGTTNKYADGSFVGPITPEMALADGMSYATAKERGLASGYTAGEWSARRNQDMPAYADGTDYAQKGIALVGEEGPELVQFGGGERVYTAGETSDILYSPPQSGDRQDTPKDNSPRIIRLEIDGSGAIEIGENMDEETVVSILQQHLKPVLAGIVKQEIYEEGENSYDF